jgi:trehalose 6-phosphate synthase
MREHNAREQKGRRLLIVSNRLPLVIEKGARGKWDLKPGAGGLVTALTPVLSRHGGLWIGSPGPAEEDGAPPLERLLPEAMRRLSYSFEPVVLTRDEVDNYYYGFANQILWPLFHDLQSRTHFDPRYWDAYCTVNRRFAGAIRAHSRPADFIWVQDYHLMGVAEALRRGDVTSRMGFFLHIPFPSPDIFGKLPWRFTVLKSLLKYDLVGFQTLNDLRNFIACVRTFLEGAEVRTEGSGAAIRFEGNLTGAGAFPISIDVGAFTGLAASEQVRLETERLRARLHDCVVILGTDRLDYTKGILDRLQAFRDALLRYPELSQKVVLVQIAVPSRQVIPEYRRLRRDIEQLIGEINGQFTESGWAPIQYISRSLTRFELMAYYRAARIAFVTPLKDGMNLVAKEYCASCLDEDGVLILSEFAGAAAQLHHEALLVNPYDRREMADAIRQAFGMAPAERRRRMGLLRAAVAREDIFWWVETFLRVAAARSPEGFPEVSEYVPRPRAEDLSAASRRPASLRASDAPLLDP